MSPTTASKQQAQQGPSQQRASQQRESQQGTPAEKSPTSHQQKTSSSGQTAPADQSSAPPISRWWLLCAIVMLGGAVLLWFPGSFSPSGGEPSRDLSHDPVYHANLLYLTHTEQEVGTELLHLLELDALISVAGSSQFGVSFIVDMNVEVGRILKRLNQVLERGTEAIAMSLAAIALLRVFVIGAELATPWLFLIFVGLSLSWLILALFHRAILQWSVARKLLRLTATLFLLCWLIIPYALHLSVVVATVIEQGFTEPTSFGYFSAVAGELKGHPRHHRDLKGHAKSSVKLLHKATSAKLHHKVERGLLVVIQFAIKMLLGLIVVPLGLSVLLHHLLCRVLLHHFMVEKGMVKKVIAETHHP
ncbi:hypothetical protein [Vibrio spartinae]|uniref:Uncharacterized protein n=1 Tax=Vibrio spartinae TaxID=1918945 RepID=A0ABX6R5K3_9VIBR|nr:hypothetical protein [Vibrio spartinae]QMV16688.1 hypothetical protein Vspart_04084 [Vibrio spartinae]